MKRLSQFVTLHTLPGSHHPVKLQQGHLFFWCNKLMGFVVIKSHLATLEKAFQKPLGSRVLDVLLLLFGLSLITATVLYVWFLVNGGKLHALILGVALIEGAVVGPEDPRAGGPEDHGTKGPEDQRTKGPGTKGPAD
ncbi:hypothetical protein AK812_SmicGene16501 [Symbiodinium microadriaticum]|uniref:Uncharacterized protein n=1 Tax=Symbiodinium microadriaticum TaxID=2951 RepID=A0A1Q9E062_SYMMI|nr:hypothetical protein AK812_SmicGene16501 [Symbiodinium microadriaticum]